MPWLTIIMALMTFFGAKKSGASSTKAALAAGLAGAGTYYVTHETEWGKANLGSLDGVTMPTPNAEGVKSPSGGTVADSAGNVVKTVVGGTADVLKSWGGTGTAAVIGTTALATSSKLESYLPWILGGLGLFLVLR